MKKYFLILLFILFFSACARSPFKHSKDLTRKVSHEIKVIDSLSRDSFFSTLSEHLEVMKTSSIVNDVLDFGSVSVEKNTYLESLEELLALGDNPEINYVDYINEHFDLYEVYGNERWSEVMVTGYYEPWVMGSKKRSLKFSRALYKTPTDLITVDLKNFQHRFSGDQKLGLLQGRIEKQSLVAYFTREEIDVAGELQSKKLEMAYVDPVDAFFIQIQGSGVVVFEDSSTMRLGYANQNGHSYAPIGKYLSDVIPLEEMSMQRIRQHLQTLTAKEQQNILNLNPSYVFFQHLTTESLTYAGMQVSEGRTIATDKFLFPKGAMAFLIVDEPVFAGELDIVANELKSLPRIVFDQDTGGAIRGPGRVDLYMGKGDFAAQKAGVMKNPGKLYYLVPRKLLN